MEAFGIDRDDLVKAIADCGLFDSIRGGALDDLHDSFDGVRVVTGETLMRQGDDAAHLFVVRHGRLRATVLDSEGAEILVGEIGKNEVVGEMAAITDQRRSATVRAMRDTDLFRLPAEAFGRLVQQHPSMLRPFASVVVNRLRNAMTRPARPSLPATIVLVPAGDDDLVGFAHSLAGQLTSFETVVLTASDSVGHSNPAAWLLDVENRAQISLLVADREPTEWTKLCLRHADRINVVADDVVTPALTAVERDPECAARFAEVPTHLVMRYRSQPDLTPWLAHRSIQSHVNVSRDDPADMARLARVMTGTANILVLGGGGARGFAHFGVVRALHEGGIPIDGMIGTSAGAVAGGAMARIGDPLLAQQMTLEWFQNARWRRDFNPPTVALMSGRTMSHGLQGLGADYLIEDLPIGFAAISCDLVTAKPFVHDRGPLWQALRASGSVPGLFPPVGVDGRLLVDGGLVANMPADIARLRHPNATLIAVEVGDPSDIDVSGIDGTGIVNGWERVRQRKLLGGASLAKVMMRLTELGRDDSVDAADVVIRPDVRGFGLIDTGRADEIVERGYEAAQAAIDEGILHN